MFIIFALSITKRIKKKKHINLRDHQNSAIDIAADTGSPVINDKRIFFWSDLKIFPFEMIERFFPQLQLILLLRIYGFWFSWVVRKCPEIGKNRKYIIWLLLPKTRIFRVWWASRTFDFFNNFFSKDSALSSASGNPIHSFHSLSATLKNRSKVKNWSESVKNDTKTGIMRVWNELRPKLFHQHLAL